MNIVIPTVKCDHDGTTLFLQKSITHTPLGGQDACSADEAHKANNKPHGSLSAGRPVVPIKIKAIIWKLWPLQTMFSRLVPQSAC
jgi:hypothetical protein